MAETISFHAFKIKFKERVDRSPSRKAGYFDILKSEQQKYLPRALHLERAGIYPQGSLP